MGWRYGLCLSLSVTRLWAASSSRLWWKAQQWTPVKWISQSHTYLIAYKFHHLLEWSFSDALPATSFVLSTWASIPTNLQEFWGLSASLSFCLEEALNSILKAKDSLWFFSHFSLKYSKRQLQPSPPDTFYLCRQWTDNRQTISHGHSASRTALLSELWVPP